MANYNLTTQQIRDTFEQLGQVSGSVEGGVSGYAIVDGTGSRAVNLHVTASQATSASYAEPDRDWETCPSCSNVSLICCVVKL